MDTSDHGVAVADCDADIGAYGSSLFSCSPGAVAHVVPAGMVHQSPLISQEASAMSGHVFLLSSEQTCPQFVC